MQERDGLDGFPANLRARREAMGLSQDALAAAIGSNGPHISDLERGVKSPVLGTIIRLADALQTTAAALVA